MTSSNPYGAVLEKIWFIATRPDKHYHPALTEIGQLVLNTLPHLRTPNDYQEREEGQ